MATNKRSARRDFLPDDLDTVGHRLKALRIKKNLTQQQVADHMDMSTATLSAIESDAGASVRTSDLMTLANLYGVNPVWIMMGGENDAPVSVKSFGYTEDDLEMFIRQRHVLKNRFIDTNEHDLLNQVLTDIEWAEDSIATFKFDDALF